MERTAPIGGSLLPHSLSLHVRISILIETGAILQLLEPTLSRLELRHTNMKGIEYEVAPASAHKSAHVPSDKDFGAYRGILFFKLNTLLEFIGLLL
jgi:hypothetical protein